MEIGIIESLFITVPILLIVIGFGMNILNNLKRNSMKDYSKENLDVTHYRNGDAIPFVKVKKYEVQTVEHFDNNGNSLGFLNEYENADLRGQIAEEKVSGYYLMFNGLKIQIEPNGKIINWENGLYDTNEILLARLFKAQM